jgi:hypothetical protein
MKKVLNNVIAYGMWIIDMALAFWLCYISRSAYLGIFALSSENRGWSYGKLMGFLDKAFLIVLGLGWLAYMIIVEQYFSPGIQKGDLLKRFCKITGPVLLCLFVVDLILFWLAGIDSGNWLRWLTLAGELGIGLAMLISSKTNTPEKTN